MINKVILVGNLGKDPEVRYLEGNVAVARFPLATNENYRDRNGNWQTRTEWHDVVLWRQLAERAEKSLKKGSMVFVEGKLTHRKWQDSQGQDRYTTEVVASLLRILDKREADDMNRSSNSGGMSGNGPSNAPDMPDMPGGEDDDLPF